MKGDRWVHSDGNDVSGGFVAIKTSGLAAGQFAYATLFNAVALEAGTNNFVVSQEVNGGNQQSRLLDALMHYAAALGIAVKIESTNEPDFEKAFAQIRAHLDNQGASRSILSRIIGRRK